ncbi:hypothetical protein BDF20DRAFT_842532 [Mycotypha africana]|uniref:uncharacterized protein n=1 Tax=Mycotypha africana TaxID=64632 RepID=UPI0023002579|nr:uncharacterized protein BDF20DRAFT_842532 [Mycotypha africana]KAI8991079.1 hypothetical protein BDF20DRAFT_842532 [Mycotypha africana]
MTEKISNVDDDLHIPYYEVPPTYEEFLENHLIPNKPCIIGPAFIDNWKARKEWIVPVDNLDEVAENIRPKYKPNYQYMRKHFGSAESQVAKCNQRHFTDQWRESMSFEQFADLWEADDGKESLWYFKDFHMMRTFPDDKFYKVPNLFEDDWLNEYWLQKGDDDYRFSYIGGHTTFTPLHADVHRSHSWSSNICGVKKWTMFPPNQEECYKDKYGNQVYDVRHVDPDQFPRFNEARRVVIYQRDGETMFIPSDWFHQVENIGAAISLNHNWINANNIMHTYRSLKKDYDDCRKSIEDIQESVDEAEFLQECQKLLLMHAGWNWRTFLSMLSCVVKNRYNALVVGKELSKNQPDLTYQMDKIEEVLDKWFEDEGGDLVKYFKAEDDVLYDEYQDLKRNITKIRELHALNHS